MSPVSSTKCSDAGARVQAPFTLSDTRTSPGAWYWENHPTSKSPWATGDVSVTVVVDIGAVENAAPWTKVGAAAAGPARAAPRNRAKPNAGHLACILRRRGRFRGKLLILILTAR